jgi:hypothetical protein
MRRLLLALAPVLLAAACDSTVDQNGPTIVYRDPGAPPVIAAMPTGEPVLSGGTLGIRSKWTRGWWFVRTGVSFNPDAPDAHGPDVIFAASTGPDRFVVEKDPDGSSPGPAIRSGDFIRLHDVEHDGWLKADIDNPLFIVSDSRVQTDPNARLRIEKDGGEPGSELRTSDPFRLRGIHGAPWLVSPTEGVVHVSGDRTQATLFEFAPLPGATAAKP